MKLGIAQIDTRAGDFSRTGERIVAYSEQAAKQGADLLVFPAATLTGPLPVPGADTDGMLADLSEMLVDLVDRLACPCIVPAVTLVEGYPTTEAFLLAAGEVTPLRFATYMNNYSSGGSVLAAHVSPTGSAASLFDRVAHAAGSDAADSDPSAFMFDAGDGSVGISAAQDAGFVGFEIGGLRFVVAFGYDELIELVDYDYAMDALLYLPTRGYAMDDPASALGAAIVEGHFQRDARATGAWLAAAGSLGCYDDQVFTGGSFVLSPAGELVAVAPSFEEGLLVVELDGSSEGFENEDDLEWGDEDRGILSAAAVAGAQSARPDRRQGGRRGAHAFRDGRFSMAGLSAESLEPEVYDVSFFCWQALVLGLRDFVRNLDATDVVLALDGTLASMALATLACDALGSTHVHALLATPLQGASDAAGRGASAKGGPAWRQVCAAAERARGCRQLAANLHLDLHERAERLAAATAATLGDAYGEPDRLAAASLEAGVARAELAALAAQLGALTLSARDKTWLALEARAGEAGADLLPFGDVYRTSLLDMAHMRNTISPVIPDVTLRACDVPLVGAGDDALESWEGLEGESLLNALDLALSSRVEWGYSLSTTVSYQGNESLTLELLAQLDRHAVARASAGCVLRVSSFALDEQRRPYAMRWSDRVRRADEFPSEQDFLDALRDILHTDEGVVSGQGRAAGSRAQGRAGASGPGAPGGRSDDRSASEILGYLNDLAQGLTGGAGPGSSPGSYDGHIASDGEGHLSFGGFPTQGGTPFSEN